MGLLLHSVLLFSLCTFAASLDFHLGSKPVGQSVFLRLPGTGEKRSLPASTHHSVKRRSTDQDESCKGLRGYQTKLSDNTHRVSYQLRSCFTKRVDAQVLNRVHN